MSGPNNKSDLLDDTPYFLCVSRCIRGAFVAGIDPWNGKNYGHRRQWIEERLNLLSNVFAIDLCSFAVLHKETHVLVHIDPEKAEQWTALEVIERWHEIYNGDKLSQAFIAGQNLSQAEKYELTDSVEKWRERLSNLSWYMRNLNEYIAKKANQEDGTSGHFWESKRKYQPLSESQMLAACLTYADPNYAGQEQPEKLKKHLQLVKS